MLNLSVRTAQTTGTSPFGETMTFDFSSDVPAGSQILAYGVGLAGFMLDYETNSPFYAENMGLLQVALVPNLVGNVLYVVGNCLMTDYDGDAGRAPGHGGGNPATSAQATAIALIGPANPNEVVLGNFYAIGNGDSRSPIVIGSNTVNAAFLSGFTLMGSGGSTGSISSLSFSVTSSNPQQGQLAVSGAAKTSGLGSSGAVDALLLSAPAQLNNYQIVPVTLSWDSPHGQSGMYGSLKAVFNVPAGQQIVYAGLLQQSVDIVYSDDAEFQLVSAMQIGALTISGNTVTGSYNLNIYNPDFLSSVYISSDSTATLYMIAQFGSAQQRHAHHRSPRR